jgi:Protein of unknown function (DUF3156)
LRGLSARRTAAVLASDAEAFERLGYRIGDGDSPNSARLTGPGGRRDLMLRLRPEGRIFGGSWGLEVSTAEPVLPATDRGIAARGRGVVKMQGVRFRARRGGDESASRLAAALSADAELGEALGRVHFERITVEPDGRPAIRHLGGSVVWLLLPPVVRATPLPAGQPEAMVAALDEFARAGERFAGADR